MFTGAAVHESTSPLISVKAADKERSNMYGYLFKPILIRFPITNKANFFTDSFFK